MTRLVATPAAEHLGDAPRSVRGARLGVVVVSLASLCVLLGWVLPDAPTPLDDLASIASVAGAAAVLLAAFGAVGAAVAMALPRRIHGSLGVGPVLGLGIAATALLGLAEQALLGRVLVSPFLSVAAGVVVLVVRVVRRGRGEGAAGLLRRVRVRAARGAASLEWVAVALVGVAMLPVARHGLTAWTLGIGDWHRYAGSALVWLEGDADFLASHPDAYGAAMAARAGFEKPAVTAMLAAAARWTGIHPVGLLAPLLVVLLVVLATSTMALVRTGLGASPRRALVASVLPVLSIAVLLPVAHAQAGGLAAAAMVSAGAAMLASTRLAESRPVGVVVGLLAGALVGVGVASNATVALAGMPVAVAVACWLVLRWRSTAAIVGVAVAVAATAALVVVATQAPRLIRSLAVQVDGTAGVPIAFPTPLGVIGLEPLGGAPVAIAVVAWLVVLAATAIAARRRMPSFDAIAVLALTALLVLGVVALGIVYGIDGYSTGKWIGFVAPLAAPPMLATALGWLAAREGRVEATLSAVALVVAPVVAGGTFAAVQLVLPASTMALADSQALEAQPVVNVDLASAHEAGLVPLLVPSAVVRSMDRTYAAASEPVGDAFVVDDDQASQRDWLSTVPLGSGLLLGSVDLDADATGVSLLQEGGRDHLFGGWLGTAPEQTLLTDDAAPGIVVLDVDAMPASILVTGFVEGPTIVRIAVGDETVEAQPADGVLAVRVPTDDVEGDRLVVTVTVRSTTEDGDAVARIDGVELQGMR